VDQQKQQQSTPKLWKRLVQATQNLAAQEDQGPGKPTTAEKA
jgi:hypothetical protein